MSRTRRLAIAATAASALAGAAIMIAGATTAGAAAPSPSPSSRPAAAAPATPPRSNEDPAHEQAETPQQEAAENSGQHPAGAGCPQGGTRQAPGRATGARTQAFMRR